MGNRVGETGKPQGRSGGGQEVPAIPAVPAGISAVLCGGFCTFMTLLGPEACLEHLLHVPQPSSFQHSRVWEHPHGTGMFLWTWIRCFRTGSSFPVGQTWNPGNGVKSSRTCSPVGAIIPKGLVVLWDVIPTGGRALSFPGLFAGACSEQLLLGMIWEGRNRLGSAAPSARTSLGEPLHPSGKPKKGRICDHWDVKYSQGVPPIASLPLNLPLPQFPMAWLFHTECATAPSPWWDKYHDHFPDPKWHFQG